MSYEIKVKLNEAQKTFLNNLSKTDLLHSEFDHGFGILACEKMAKYLLVRAIDDLMRSGWKDGKLDEPF